jgi:5-methylcytosine-specific restriction enzyme subunit McrC
MEVALEHLTKTRTTPRRGDRSRVARLAGHFRAFEEVGSDSNHGFLTDLQVQGLSPLPDSRSYYRPALDLAVLMLRDIGIALELGGDDVELGSLLIDTNALFEKFVRVSLAKQAVKRGWQVDVLDGNTAGSVDLYSIPEESPTLHGQLLPPLAANNAGRAQPDVVLRALDGTTVLIAEVKNTLHGQEAAATDSLPQRSEVEQAVTYALRYGLPFTVLVHPWRRGTKGLLYVGRIRTIDVYDYRLDLSLSDGLDAALDAMADAFASIADLNAQPSNVG